ncbi:MAG TPA: hypothetical protein VF438_00095 [Candidatus Paceibacterota bacterium]
MNEILSDVLVTVFGLYLSFSVGFASYRIAYNGGLKLEKRVTIWKLLLNCFFWTGAVFLGSYLSSSLVMGHHEEVITYTLMIVTGAPAIAGFYKGSVAAEKKIHPHAS